jgi:hypothetical protein
MRAPKSNFCCAADLALISELAASGGGTIGIASYRSRQANPRSKTVLANSSKPKLFICSAEHILKAMINRHTAALAFATTLTSGISHWHSVD